MIAFILFSFILVEGAMVFRDRYDLEKHAFID
jgi:hypothetical protein